MSNTPTSPKPDLMEMLKAALKAQGVKVAHIKGKTGAGAWNRPPRLQIMLPLGKAMHIFIIDGKLLLSEGGEIYKADRYMELADPKNDPQAIVDMFNELLQTQNKFLSKFGDLDWKEAGALHRKAHQ